eukprot:8230221-Pyramimonas_sp.AAC.1
MRLPNRACNIPEWRSPWRSPPARAESDSQARLLLSRRVSLASGVSVDSCASCFSEASEGNLFSTTVISDSKY